MVGYRIVSGQLFPKTGIYLLRGSSGQTRRMFCKPHGRNSKKKKSEDYIKTYLAKVTQLYDKPNKKKKLVDFTRILYYMNTYLYTVFVEAETMAMQFYYSDFRVWPRKPVGLKNMYLYIRVYNIMIYLTGDVITRRHNVIVLYVYAMIFFSMIFARKNNYNNTGRGKFAFRQYTIYTNAHHILHVCILV